MQDKDVPNLSFGVPIGKIIAEGELSTSITIFPSNKQAAAVSGRSVYLNFGNGLIHLC